MANKKIIKVCTGGACSQNLSPYTKERAENDIHFYNISEKAELQECPCQGNCEYGPTVIVEDEDGKNKHQFSKVDSIEMSKIIRKIKNNQLHPPHKKNTSKNK